MGGKTFEHLDATELYLMPSLAHPHPPLVALIRACACHPTPLALQGCVALALA